jgi:microsomal dipeptidase-like Zn-dependent dipeptidase
MKKSIPVLFLLLCGGITTSTSQTPVITKQGPPVLKGAETIVVNSSSGLIKYDAAARIKYTFYDVARFTEVPGRTMPDANDFITLYTVIGGKEYTLVPANDLSVEGSATGLQNVSLVLTGGVGRAAGTPTGPAIWKITRTGGGLVLAYNGAFANTNPETVARGGYLGFQSGQVKISGNATGITPGWQFQIVTEGINTLLRLQNTGDNKYLGYSYSEARPVPTMPVVYGNFAVNVLAESGCAGSTICNTKWFYKIYRAERTTGGINHGTPLDPDSYMINVSYDDKSLLDFGGVPAFGTTNRAMVEMQWKFEPTSRGTYFIISKKSGKALGVNKANNKLMTAPLDNNDFYYTDNLQWIIKGPFGGRFTLAPYMDRARPNETNVLTCKGQVAGSIEGGVRGSYWQEFIVRPPDGPLWGYVDMHTHPLSNVGFGNQFFYGAPDGDPAKALGSCNCIHNYIVPPGDGNCNEQNLIRNKLMDVLDGHTKGAGYPDFNLWPKQSTTTHQQMWYEWVDRARRSGLRTIVALAQNSHTLADGMETVGPYDDLRSMNDQIRELILFVRRHPGMMDTVTTAARMRQVVQSGRLAVIIGIEMDNIGNFYNPSERRAGEVYNATPTDAAVKAEIDRLYAMGVRYVFPIHIVNNAFGGAAVYGDDMEPILFNLSNFYITGSRFTVEAVPTASTGIGFKCPDLSAALSNSIVRGGIDVLRHIPGLPLKPEVMDVNRYSYPDPGHAFGHRNVLGLSTQGEVAVKYMMSKGMIVDIDHMSERSVSRTLQLATQFDYPVSSGHNGPRGGHGNEKARTNGQYDTLKMVGGMIGVGTGDAEAGAFVNTFRSVLRQVGGKNITFGTDVGVGAKLPHAPSPAARLTGNIPGLEPCRTGNKTWDFNTYNTGGVDHYGLMPEFVKSLDGAGLSANEKNALYGAAEYFAQMWEKCELNKRNVR